MPGNRSSFDNPRDITTVYQLQDSREVFLTRAHAQGWETEVLSYAEAQALSQRRREAGKAISNRSMLEEVRERDGKVKKLQKQKKQNLDVIKPFTASNTNMAEPKAQDSGADLSVSARSPESVAEVEIETIKLTKPVPYVRVYDYEELGVVLANL
jgi:putative transposase